MQLILISLCYTQKYGWEKEIGIPAIIQDLHPACKLRLRKGMLRNNSVCTVKHYGCKRAVVADVWKQGAAS